ncbi:MAG: hypothetical protein KY462_07890 [Actinobacteria bacterium]|nr:hypothetical protein [Actinomycetota bacterium]
MTLGGGDAGSDRDPVVLGSGTPLLEWVIALIGAALAVAILVVLVLSAVNRSDGPPQPQARPHATVTQPDSYLVTVDVINRGGTAATGVQIQGELHASGAVVERTEAVVDVLPPSSSRRVGLVFERDPAAHEVRVRVIGFEQP